MNLQPVAGDVAVTGRIRPDKNDKFRPPFLRRSQAGAAGGGRSYELEGAKRLISTPSVAAP